MSKTAVNYYVPDYAVHPGEILDEYLEAQAMSQVELAARTGLVPKTINEIIKGKAAITSETALKLERVLGRPAHFWNNLQQQYEEALARLDDQARLEGNLGWLGRVPVKVMARLGWIKLHSDKREQLEEVLRFFGVASCEQWRAVWEKHQVAYRQSQRFETHAEAVSAWLRRGEIEGQAIACAPYNKQRFKEVLVEVRHLTREAPEVFPKRLIELCAGAGVAVVFVQELPKTCVSGATRWLNPEKALIQLSLRYKTDDHLWFTFFHEAGHVVLHGKKDVFLEGQGMDDEKEQEANDFAADTLIPPGELETFRATRGRPTLVDIRGFADRIGIAPGIVVGRLQHDKVIPRSVGNDLKRRFCWAQ